MLSNQRIPMTEMEEEAVNRLLAKEAGPEAQVSLARNEPGESGPIRLELDDGRVWLIEESGRYAKARV